MDEDRPGGSPGDYDHIVVGAGAAGCVVARRLATDPGRRVLLLEAGGRDDDPDMAIPFRAPALQNRAAVRHDATVPQPALDGRRVTIRSGRVLGGGSTVNYLVWQRGHARDYDGWAAAGMAGWSADEVRPYFRRIEHHELGATAVHGAGGPIAVTRPAALHPHAAAFIAAGERAGLPRNDDFTESDLDGVGVLYANVRTGRRDSTATAYLHRAPRPDDLVTVTGAQVERILFDGTRVAGVRYREHGRLREVRSPSVVLCAGALRSPQLLMLSGVGPADHLVAHGIDPLVDLPGVGADLQDHASVPIVWDLAAPDPGPDDEAALAQWRRRGTGPLASLCEAGAFLRTGAAGGAPDIQVTVQPRRDGVGDTADGLTAIVTLLSPSSRGTVSLRSADPADPPRIDPRYLHVGSDAERLLEGFARVLQIAAEAPLRGLLGRTRHPAPDDDDPHRYLRRRLFSIHHAAGTCRAGADERAVVDAELRVRGVTGLRVVDASVMPTITSGNVLAPTIMIAERGADLLRAAAPRADARRAEVSR